jgi:hypothetical protein
MDSNTDLTQQPTRPPEDGLDDLAVAVRRLVGQDLDGLGDAVRAGRVLRLRRLVDCLEGQWLNELAGVDAHGAAGAEEGLEAGSTAGWLRNRLRMGAGTAAISVRTALALFRGPLSRTAEALTDGEVSAAHARVLARAPATSPTTSVSRPNRS